MRNSSHLSFYKLYHEINTLYFAFKRIYWEKLCVVLHHIYYTYQLFIIAVNEVNMIHLNNFKLTKYSLYLVNIKNTKKYKNNLIIIIFFLGDLVQLFL